jgi:hypothetical protein
MRRWETDGCRPDFCTLLLSRPTATYDREVRRAPLGPGLWPGPRRQARRVGRGSARKGGSRRCFLRSGFCGAVRKDLRVPLWVEGPTRTMRGVPTRCLRPFTRRPTHLARDDRPGQLAGRMTHGALRRGCVLRRGAGHRRVGQRPATMRYRARGSGPGCPATCGESPQHPWPLWRGTARSSRSSCLSCASFGLSQSAWRAEGAPLKP